MKDLEQIIFNATISVFDNDLLVRSEKLYNSLSENGETAVIKAMCDVCTLLREYLYH